jgi:PadR family transcriptional regulator, regulatory protein PadR
MYGQELAVEIEKRRGEKPNPGTIYPALKDLTSRGLIRGQLKGRSTVYELTPAGKESLSKALEYFERAFGEIFRSAAKVQRRLARMWNVNPMHLTAGWARNWVLSSFLSADK